MSSPSPGVRKVTAPAVQRRKLRHATGPRITALTAYDYPTARLVDEAGIDVILVGDSIGNVVLGYDSTLPVTLEEMIHAAQAVCRGATRALVVGDLPFGSYHRSAEQAIESSIRLVKEAGVAAVKLEGGVERVAAIRAVVDAGVPVMAHIGLRPQAVNQMGGYRVQGRSDEGAERLRQDALAVAAAGAFAVVIEGVPAAVAKDITERIDIPTIGIGAGVDCDGQILVLHDLIGLNAGHQAKFVRRYAQVGEIISAALLAYKDDVEQARFPSAEESY